MTRLFTQYSLRQPVDDVIDFVNHIASVAVLLLDTVDPCLQWQIVDILHQTFVHHSRTQRTEGIHGFAQQKLSAIAFLLPVTGRNVLGDTVAEDIVERLLLGHLASDLANDNDQLHFPVDFL